MIKLYRSDYGDNSVDGVCGVQPSAEAHFEDRESCAALVEIEKRDRGHLFEESRKCLKLPSRHEALTRLANDRSEPREIGFGYLLAVESYPLLNANQMRRGVQCGLVPGDTSDRINHRRDRALSVGAGDNHRLK